MLMARIDLRERIDGFDAKGKLVDVHRWDPRACPRQTNAVAVRAVILADMAENQGVVTARILGHDGSVAHVDSTTVQTCKELHHGEA